MKPTATASTPVGSKRLQSAYYAVALFVLITVSLYWGHAVFVPLALSTLFAFILSTPAAWLEKKGLGRVASVLAVTLGAFGVLAGVGTVASTQLQALYADLPRYEKNIDRKLEPVYDLLKRLKDLESRVEDTAPPSAKADPADQPTNVIVKSPSAGALSWLPSLARPLVEILVNGVLVVVLTLFMLMQRETFRDRLIRLAGRGRMTSTTRALGDAADRVGKFLLLQLATNAALGAVIAAGLYLMGVPYAPLWGLLVTALRFIPYIGYWVAALAAVAMSAAVSPPGSVQPLVVVALFLILDMILTNVIEPLVFSHGTGVSPVALLIAAVFWASLWGPVGLLLATPLTVCLAVLGKHVPALGFLAVLLGDEPALDAAARYYNRLLARDYDDATMLLVEYETDHPPEALYDEVILPALAQVKTDREQRDVTDDEEEAVYEATRSLLDGVTERAGDAATVAGGVRPTVIGCPVWGEADALAVRMLGDAARPAGLDVVVTSPEHVIADLAKVAAGDRPPVVCLATLSPGGLAQAGTVLARVRRQFPQVKVYVGRWGQTGDTKKTEEYIRKFGVTDIGWSLRDTLGQLIPGWKPTAAASKATTPDAQSSAA